MLAMLIALSPSTAHADDNHYQNYLVGERAVGLGGAFTAIADDSSGAYYNPAGLAEAPYSSLSLSAAVYGFVFESAAIEAIGFESSENTFVSYPTTAAWIQLVRKGDASGVGRVQFAISLVTPRSAVERRRLAYQTLEQSDAATNRQLFADNIEIESVEDDSLWAGLSIAWKLHRRVSVGATLYATIRTGVYQFFDSPVLRLLEGGAEIDRLVVPDRSEARVRHIGLVGVIGSVLTVSERLRVGVAFRAPKLRLHGKVKINSMQVDASTDPDTGQGVFQVDTEDLDAKFHDRQPWRATIGAAFIRPRVYGLSIDLSLYGPVGEHFMVTDSGDAVIDTLLPMQRRLVPQMNVGGEVYVARALALRLGFFTNLSSLGGGIGTLKTEDCPAGERCNWLFADGIDRLGVSGSVGYEIDRATLTLGWSYTFGSHTEQAAGVALDTSRSFLFFMVGGSFRF
jgi:hypothetical protein